jgi:hypothetical protein
MRFLGDMGIAGSTVRWLKALPSVIIFRLQDQRPANVNRRLEVVLREASTELKDGAIISVDEYRYRIRRLPIHP